MSVHILAGGPGPAMFLGSSIMSFVLPYAAFIIITASLFVMFRAKHSGPRLKYLSSAPVTSVITREPGPAVALKPKAKKEASAEASSPDAGKNAGGAPGKDAEGTE